MRINSYVITLPQLTAANWQVMDEMEQLGLWHDELDDVDICIPAGTGANLSDLITGHHTRFSNKPAILRKWEFMEWMAGRVSKTG